jgi:hypothetical protein
MQDRILQEKPHQTLTLENGYNVIVSSTKPLVNGKNDLSIKILKNDNIVKDADVNIVFQLDKIPNMEFSEHAIEKAGKYNLSANFKVPGEWKYELMFKTNYGVIYSKEGKVNIN